MMFTTEASRGVRCHSEATVLHSHSQSLIALVWKLAGFTVLSLHGINYSFSSPAFFLPSIFLPSLNMCSNTGHYPKSSARPSIQ
jgi:hypothetical protein